VEQLGPEVANVARDLCAAAKSCRVIRRQRGKCSGASCCTRAGLLRGGSGLERKARCAALGRSAWTCRSRNGRAHFECGTPAVRGPD
jgi:hypothetical protein